MAQIAYAKRVEQNEKQKLAKLKKNFLTWLKNDDYFEEIQPKHFIHRVFDVLKKTKNISSTRYRL